MQRRNRLLYALLRLKLLTLQWNAAKQMHSNLLNILALFFCLSTKMPTTNSCLSSMLPLLCKIIDSINFLIQIHWKPLISLVRTFSDRNCVSSSNADSTSFKLIRFDLIFDTNSNWPNVQLIHKTREHIYIKYSNEKRAISSTKWRSFSAYLKFSNSAFKLYI